MHPPPPSHLPPPDATLVAHASEFFDGCDLTALKRYVEGAYAVCDCRRSMRVVSPMFVPRETLAEIAALCEAFARLVREPTFVEAAAAPTVFRPRPLAPRDLIGNIDLHLGADGPRIIEAHANLPGGTALAPAMHRHLIAEFGLEPDTVAPHALYAALAECVPERGGRRRVAVAISHRKSAEFFLADFRAVAAQLEAAGVEAELVYAEDVEVTDAGLAWGGQRYDDVLSLVIPPNFELDPSFPRFIAARDRFPEAVFPDPTWGRVTTKRMLPLLADLDRWAPTLSAADRAVIAKASLPAARLSAFDSVDAVLAAFGSTDALVVKPERGYQSKGVHVRPSRATLEALLTADDDSMIVQAYYPARPVPTLDVEGRVRWISGRLRPVFVRGRFATCYMLEDEPGEVPPEGGLGVVCIMPLVTV